MTDPAPARQRQADAGRDWVRSPCVGICELDAGGNCRGCRRTLEEVAGWLGYTPAQRDAIIADLERRQPNRPHAGGSGSRPADSDVG
jgi:uncharacterized protein